MKTPSVEMLQDPRQFELVDSVKLEEIKEFVLAHALSDKKLVPAYMVYQTIMVVVAIFFFTRSVVLAWKGDPRYLVVTLITLFLSVTLLVIIHELLHGIALKIAGAPKVRYGGNLRRFIFYAEADKFVMGRPVFMAVAFAPLIVVQLVTIAGVVIWWSTPVVYSFLMLMSIHSLFCAGDIALSTIFFKYPGRRVFTYDDQKEKTSYYYVEKEGNP